MEVKMNKKILLAIITVSLLLAGCGKSVPTNTTQQDSKSASYAIEPNSEDAKSTVTTTPSDSKNEAINTKQPSENNKNLAMNAYKAVLQNKAEFYSTDNKKNIYLNDFLTNKKLYDTTLKVTRFAVLDMDGDKIPEVVLELTAGDYPEFYEILHYMDDKVYGYFKVYRGLEMLKVDGTFWSSGGASDNECGKLRFNSNAYETDVLGYMKSSQDNGNLTISYSINNKPVTKEAFDSFTKEQNGKKGVDWYELSESNIKTKIADNQSSSNPQSSNLNQGSKKQEYKAKLDKIKLEFKGYNSASATTNDMYQEVCKEYKEWDAALNEIYGVLKVQLSASDMKNLQNEELQWIKDRDATAKNAAAEMAGGTMEKVLYQGSLANSTQERCYELIDKYMK
jgi:uncharacterized protein YecT (DUF1311 family)